MKKMFLTVAIALTTFGVAQANLMKNYDVKTTEQTKIETVQDVVALNDSTPHIIRFYEVEKIVINNDSNAHIRIYNDKWEIIEDTNGDVNIAVEPGNYYVASDKKLKTRYVVRG